MSDDQPNDRHPQPQDIVWVVEVADSTLRYDREVKAKLYGLAGIPEYWVLDLQNRQLHIFQESDPTGYARQIIVQASAQVRPLAFPEVTLPVESMLPPG